MASGVQYVGTGPAPTLVEIALSELDEVWLSPRWAGRSDRATYVDEAGYTTVITVVYWDQPENYDRWFGSAHALWLRDRHIIDEANSFVETLRPSVSRFETLFSNDRREGVAWVGGWAERRNFEHVYWGRGTRPAPDRPDRSPLPRELPTCISGDLRLRVHGQHNLCLIRSGRDWTDTDDDERRMYLEEVEPTLRAGMEFLRDEGSSIGCYSNRYVRLVDGHGRPIDKSFGVSWWRSMADLDQWAKEHPTHKAIFEAR